ncbi:MAG: hypothetical protein PHX77_06590, partial [Candidatus Bipolaricaulis sp.]|nr:hypothetical protein [Candidatus Bipolaricaulis sp.]
PSHAYESPGDYGVELRVTDARGDSASRTARIRVAPAGRVVSVDDPTGAVLISLGEENGVRTGDRFDVADAACRLQVVELIGGDAAACRLLTGGLPTVGAVVQSVSPEE